MPSGVPSQLLFVLSAGVATIEDVIAHLRGKILDKSPNQVIVDCGGVGYDVTISVPTFSELGGNNAEVSLFVHTHVREDSLALYGFLHVQEKQLFERLLTVSGIGPKLAITVLSMAAIEVVSAIRGNDVTRLTKIPGVGKKTAERMILELKDKLDHFGAAPPVASASQVEEDVISALVNLGYQRAAAEQGLARAVKSGTPNSFDQLFRATLGMLSR
jgi:holliday junction DNA helicase RuvA